jgi:16S rRNA (cytidine1402-2'-O)-methyltransferase
MAGVLYVVPTPIGNLEDITLRALRVLKDCGAIACEDTRQTIKLLNHFEIKKPLISFYSHNQAHRLPELIGDMRGGKDIALVSDCGMPGISDPGYVLIDAAIKEGITVTVLPGPCAAVTALVASGLPMDGFIFLGFLRRKPGKMKKELSSAGGAGKTVVFYESPHRIIKTLAICAEVFGPQTRAAIGREMTKKFEEVMRGTLAELQQQLEARKEVLGEFVVSVCPVSDSTADDTKEDNEQN